MITGSSPLSDPIRGPDLTQLDLKSISSVLPLATITTTLDWSRSSSATNHRIAEGSTAARPRSCAGSKSRTGSTVTSVDLKPSRSSESQTSLDPEGRRPGGW